MDESDDGNDPDAGAGPNDGDEPAAGAGSPDGGESDTTDTSVTLQRMSLRGGGWIGYSDDAVFVDRDDERVKIPRDAVVEVALRTIEWDLAVMSVLLVGVGGFVAWTRNPLVGVAFAAIGLASCYWTYGKRNELRIRVENERKPVTVYPEHPQECHGTLVDSLGLEPAR
jgi:hypothetical protein